MTPAERLFNVGAALSVWWWAIMGILHDLPVDGDWLAIPVVRWALAALHVGAGLLFLTRAPLRHRGSNWDLATVLISFFTTGLLFTLAGSPGLWPWYAELLFIGGTLGTLGALTTLGSAFAIVPADRGVVERGPYQWIRHPAYAAETVMLAACVVAMPTWWALAAFGCALASLGLRIIAEERLLGDDQPYRSYCETVRWRLVPFVW